MTVLRAVLVDDEPAAIRRLSALLEESSAVSVIGTASSGDEALMLIDELAPDLIFLDIQMPGMNGLDLAEAISRRHMKLRVIFVTAYDRFALRAFDVLAAGYLLKPVDRRKLDRALGSLTSQVLANPATSAPCLWLGSGGELHQIPVTNIIRLQAERDFVRVHTTKASLLVSGTLEGLTREAGQFGMMRVHKSHAVPLQEIEQLRHIGHGAWCAVLRTGERVPIGRSYLHGLKRSLERATK
ncbi:LytTR family DNA-binding domain-containing protein [Erythrobacter sp.]|uniref:LytR/AlgR family response regulator transcription factor n=1 Tax=Erythrobacter sp. TaxID=1042 RepID=UPI0025E56A1A|nr:LytTR family DNA-binding domain-containing protein [Erythrobacter sp.]